MVTGCFIPQSDAVSVCAAAVHGRGRQRVVVVQQQSAVHGSPAGRATDPRPGSLHGHCQCGPKPAHQGARTGEGVGGGGVEGGLVWVDFVLWEIETYRDIL